MKKTNIITLIILLFFNLIATQNFYAENHINTNEIIQNSPKRVIKKEIRNIKKGKTDTISSLINIAIVLDNDKLKSKHKKEGVKAIESNYQLIINSFVKKTSLEKKKNKEDKNAYSKYQGYQKVLEFYVLRIKLADVLKRINTKIDLKNPENLVELNSKKKAYYLNLEKQKILAAEYFYSRAEKVITSKTNKNSYQRAYYDLLKANSLVYDYKDISELSKLAIKKGTIFINFQPSIIESSAYSKNIKSALDFAVKKYKDQYHLNTPFLDLSSNKAFPDYTAKFFAGKITTNTIIRDPKKSNRKKTVSVKDVKTEITATVFNHSKERETSVDVTINLLNSKKKKVKEYKVSGFDVWSDYWVTYTGNIEALSKSDKRNLKKPKPFPASNILANEAIGNLTSNTSRFFDYLNSLTYSISLDKIK